MLKSISSIATGRRSKWVVIAIWVILGVGLSTFQPKLQEATTNENEAFLPASAESTEVNNLIEDRFADGREVDALVAYHREGGLTAADRKRIAADAKAVCKADLAGVIAVVPPFGEPACGRPPGVAQTGAEEGAGPDPGSAEARGSRAAGATAQGPKPVSKDRTLALTLVRTNSEASEEIQANVSELREIVPAAGTRNGELSAHVTGIAGIVSDSIETFESIDVTLLLVTVSLVLVLLLLIYRSPVIALVPLLVVGIAYGIAAAIVYGLVKAGAVEVNGQTTSLLIVLMFGAGTDYALLIVARFREELRRTPEKHEAMSQATQRTAPAILSAGGTVVAAMLVLTLADFKATQTMGPVLALGVAIMLLAGLTFLPAVLAALGRGAFWPSRPELGSDERRPLDVWRRIGHFVHERPAFVIAATVLVLAAGSLGNLHDRGSLDFGEGFRNEPDSVAGQRLIEEKLSGGTTAATNVVVASSTARDVAAALTDVEGVQSVTTSASSKDGKLTRLDAVLAHDPFSDEATELVPDMREAAERAAGGELALVGGPTAESYDSTQTLRADAKVVVPLVLVLILLILAVLLRAIVAPLYLVATVVLSYAFAIGASTLIFTELFNQPDGDPGLPTFAFIFLVALGVDYNIFLISRIREEAARQETKEAVIAGLERTGGVITSAGIILAGTFMALLALPLEAIFQIGFTVAFGLLIDTFVVRTLLVPAIAFKLGERNWWPGRVSHSEAIPAARQPEPAPGS